MTNHFLDHQTVTVLWLDGQFGGKAQAIDERQDVRAVVRISGLKEAGSDQITSPNHRPFRRETMGLHLAT